MNALIIGGSGLLGSHAAGEALARGHAVSILSRGNVAPQAGIEMKVRRLKGDVYAMRGQELSDIIAGHDAVIYALGIDDRQLHKRPAYHQFHADHVIACMKALHAARAGGARKFAVLGSYFTHFDQRFPELGLAKHNPYIKTRCEQRDAVLAENGPGFDAFVLELPYILGSLPGRVPPWTFLFSMLAGRGKKAFFFMEGGTAAVTARQVGQAVMGAIEGSSGGSAYPLGGCNLRWTDFARAFFESSGIRKELIGIPPWLFRAFGSFDYAFAALRGKERGLSLRRFAEFQYMEAFIDPETSMKALGYPHDDYRSALDRLIGEWIAQRGRP